MADTALTVTTTRTWPDGITDTEQHHHTWPGYLPDEAARVRHASLSAAKRDVTRDGATITVRTQREQWSQVEVLAFSDPDQDALFPAPTADGGA